MRFSHRDATYPLRFSDLERDKAASGGKWVVTVKTLCGFALPPVVQAKAFETWVSTRNFPRSSPPNNLRRTPSSYLSTIAALHPSNIMFRRQALRASRTAYLASVGVAGVIAAETGNSEEQNTSVDVVTNAPAESTEVEVPRIAVEPPKRVLVELPDKLSIYPKPTPTLVLLDTPSLLELRIGQVRRELCGYCSGARAQVQGIIDRWIHVEGMVESRIKSFRDPSEPLNPGLLYTGVSALTASVLVRSRSLPTRFLLPPLSLLGAFAYFLPRTADRVGDWVEELEGTYAPRAGEIRRTGVAHTSMAWAMLGDRFREGKQALGRGARSAVEGIEDSTGLKLGDAVGWTKATGNKTSGSNEDKKA
ncbi:hypothetical protein BS17DRAFT_371352 [Gyrodon lividus]|nr:hypothetical protein BS17DRAFT_371352 [Gyrodon lividus]